MRRKAAFLLAIFLVSLFPIVPVKAESQLSPSITDAANFLYLSDAILTPESDLDLAEETGGELQAPVLTRALPDEVDLKPLLGRIIHAKKMERNDLDANCDLLVSQLRAEGKDCEADQVQAYCKEKRAEINTLIGYYHQKRGDQRKFFTRVWHNIKRNASNFWYRIGPVGRNFLRQMGDEVLQIVASGGTLSGGALKNLVKSYVKAEARARIKQVVYQGVERLLRGQLEIAKAAGVDICDPGQEVFQEDEGEETQETSGPLAAIPDGAEWKCQDINGLATYARNHADSIPAFETIKYDEEHWLVFNKKGQVIHYYYAYDFSRSEAITQTDGTLGEWAPVYWRGKDEDTNVPLDDNGVFALTLAYDEYREDRYGSAEVPWTMNIWGLIPPEDFQTAYICNFQRMDMPSGLETLTPENFRQRCGIGYYYECYLSGK